MDASVRLRWLMVGSIGVTLAFVLIGALVSPLADTASTDSGQMLSAILGISSLVLAAFSAAASVYLVGLFGRYLRDHARLEAGLPVEQQAARGSARKARAFRDPQ